MKKKKTVKTKRPRPNRRGIFLTFEGGEGSGKSTQARKLAETLQSLGYEVVHTREPGGTDVGQRIRALVLDARIEKLSPRAELLLYEADRAHHVDFRILPALEAGKIVICDRFADSSTVYQGFCRKLGVKTTHWLNRYATAGLRPDLVFLLDIPETDGLARVRRRADAMKTAGSGEAGLDRLEKEALAFHRQVRRGFLTLARQSPRRFAVLDAKKSEAQLSEAILQKVESQLKRRGLWK